MVIIKIIIIVIIIHCGTCAVFLPFFFCGNHGYKQRNTAHNLGNTSKIHRFPICFVSHPFPVPVYACSRPTRPNRENGKKKARQGTPVGRPCWGNGAAMPDTKNNLQQQLEKLEKVRQPVDVAESS